MAFIASVDSWNKILKTKKLLIGFALLAASTLVTLGFIRGVTWNHILTPFDSFIVGPHLLNHNIEIIEGQKQHLNSRYSSPPGYSLFSGIYVFFNVLFDLFGIEVFKHHIEVVFWKRHAFDFLPAFNNKYNSYYTGALAVVIEGWWVTGILSFFIGFFPHIMRFKMLKTIILSLSYLFVFSLFRNSIFHNPSMSWYSS